MTAGNRAALRLMRAAPALLLLIAAVALLPSREADAQTANLGTACPTNVRAEAGTRQVTLHWECDDANVAGYEYRMKGPGEEWTGWLPAGGREARSFAVRGIGAGAAHAFQVRARGATDVVVAQGGARRQFVTTMLPGPNAGNINHTLIIAAMPFRTGDTPRGYLMTGARVKFFDFRRDNNRTNDEVGDSRTTVVKLRATDDRGTQTIGDDRPGSLLATLTLVGGGRLVNMRSFRLPGGRELSPNTVYWLTVNEGIPCNIHASDDSTQCQRAYVSTASSSQQRSVYGWNTNPTGSFNSVETRSIPVNWGGNLFTGLPFEYDILGHTRVSRRVTAHGAPSAEVSATATPGAGRAVAPPPPAPGEAVRVRHDGSSLRVTWQAPARATHYDVTYAADGVHARAAWNRAGTGLTIRCDSRPEYRNRHCIDRGATYTVGVRARNASGASAWTNSADATFGVPPPTADRSTAPGPVSGISVVHDGSSLAVSWNATPGATHYDVTYASGGLNARAAWNRAGTSLTITCDIRTRYEGRNCIENWRAYTVGVRARNAGGAGPWRNSAAAAMPELSVAGTSVQEPNTGTRNLNFVVRLRPAATRTVTVDYTTVNGTATAGSDYTAKSGTLTFSAGQTSKTVQVTVQADAHNEGRETLGMRLSNASGARIVSAEATGAITNDGPIPGAWMARFGRTVADQVIGAVEARLQAGRDPGMAMSLAGERIDPGSLFGSGDADRRLAGWMEGGAVPGRDGVAGSRTVSGRELLSGSSFALTMRTAGGGSAAFWGRGAVTRFDGREGVTSLDDEVATALLGMDWRRGQATAGLIVGHSRGDGEYWGASGGGGMSSTLSGLWPWGRYAVSERVEAWGVAGWGEGRLSLTPEDANGARGVTLRADLDLAMGAAGLRGTLLDGGEDGLTLTVKTDAMAVRTTTGRGRGTDGGLLAEEEATVTRLRLGLEAHRPIALERGGLLTLSFEAGLRHDGGDAETGTGVDLGGGLVFADPARGLEAELRARGLLTHEAGGFREHGLMGSLHWRQQPGTDRGARLSLTQTVGGAASGGADALLGRTTLGGLAANDDDGDAPGAQSLEVRFGYGLAAFSSRFTLTPEASAGFSDTGRDYRLGLRLMPAGEAGAFEFSLEALRREADDGAGAAPVEHEVGARLTSRW